MKTYQMWIDSQWVDPSSGEWIDSQNPFTGETWARIPKGAAEDANRAVEAAYAAYDKGEWADMTASRRGALLRKLGDLIAENAEHLADTEVTDNGKLKAEMYGQMQYMPEWYYYYGGLADKVEGANIPTDKAGMFNFTQYEPLGVVAIITPWNSPLLLATWKIAPALAAGNTVVVKPSEFTSASMLELAKLVEQAGFPKGVFNVVTGYGPDVGSALVEHPKVARIGFTGGEIGGVKVYEAAARGLKKVSLELGGKSPNIVFDDANLDNAVKGAISGIFAATGQTCMAGSRLLVQESIHDEFVERLIALAKTAKMGNPMDMGTQVGPVTTRPQFEKVLSYINIAKEEGATCVLGGKAADRPECGDGWFVEPTIFTGVSNNMRIAQEEVFGPVLSIIPFKDEDEAVHIANDVLYGLAAGVWTQDMSRALRMTKKIRAGTVWVNAYRVISYMSPFGGYKRSGIGRENGQEMIKEYLQVKSIYINTGDIANPFVLG
ncbi:aldehyde dehydrogenase (NAD+) [Natronocella acetinitrilica]|uniref:Aldehyde dehydrogenase (NAD+) n=1 Tax=Natronocella acetinitrilica TaxID=414046 RepID=A0AAE3KAJ5_9GAMM|nr:aldehyde dehydrogenase [Natronocella acetinitrilica]MCP1673491.1 aldehyde dehydrogenase (NAD+) [Natronocella acetinitrilica]